MVTGIILASGFSQRMNKEKLLLPVDGVFLVERVVRAAASSLLDDIVLVYQNDQVKKLAEKQGVRTVYNKHAARGQSAAIKAGIQSAGPGTRGFMFLVGDQPFLTPEIINTIIDVFAQEPGKIVVPVYSGTRGNPVIFPSSLRTRLYGLEGDRGGRAVIDQMHKNITWVAIESRIAGCDIDTTEDYEEYTGRSGGRSA